MMPLTLIKRNSALQSLKTIYGVGRVTAKKLLGTVLLNPRASFSDLEKNMSSITQQVKNLLTEFELRRAVFVDMIEEIKNNTYKGLRMLNKSPVRGQRTKTNGNTPKNQHKKGVFFPFGIKRITKDNAKIKSLGRTNSKRKKNIKGKT